MSSTKLNEVEALKTLGNKEFQKGNLHEAINRYTEAIDAIDAIKKKASAAASDENNAAILLRATLVSNTAMCRLKQCEQYHQHEHQHEHEHDVKNKNRPEFKFESLFQVIDDITSTIKSMDKLTLTTKADKSSSADKTTMRSKLFYRRAMARYTLSLQSQQKHQQLSSSTATSTSTSGTQLIQLLSSAQMDLHQLLSFDPKNKAAKKLLQDLKENSPKLLKESGVSSSTSPISNALNNLHNMMIMLNGGVGGGGKDSSGNNVKGRCKMEDYEQAKQSLKFINASLLDDLTNGAHELLQKEMHGGKVILHFALQLPLSSAVTCNDDLVPIPVAEEVELQVLALQALTIGCGYPAFSKTLQRILSQMGDGAFESKVFSIVSSKASSRDLVNSVMGFQMRLTVNVHVQEDDDSYIGDDDYENRVLSSAHQIATVSAALKSHHEQCRSTGLNLLTTWLEPNPLLVIERSMATVNSSAKDDKISISKVKEPSDKEVSQMAPRKLAEYRKCCARRGKTRIERSRRNALEFCKMGGLHDLISSAIVSTKTEGYWRRECVLAVGRIVNYIRDETAPKGDDDTFIDENTKNAVQTFFKEEAHELTIEEIETEIENEVIDDSELTGCMNRCLFATALFLANGEVGVWALQQVWKYAKSEWENLAVSDNHFYMAIASECASAAAGIEGARGWISNCINTEDADGVWKRLLSCDDREVRSGAASTMAKLGLADKTMSTDEGELLALLEVAAGLLEEEETDIDTAESKNAGVKSFHASTERGIELLSYLSSKTSVKNEIACGFAFSSKGSPTGCSLLETLVDLSDKSTSPAICYSLATIFTSLSVSIETLRQEAFADKELTPEQYDDLQAMGKTAEERKVDSIKKEVDDLSAVNARIRKMVNLNVPRALVNLVENATEATIQQAVEAMMRIACLQDCRGSMIQQGCLSTCIKLSKNGELSENEKKIVRLSQHTIAKMLVTTNPSLLNTSQCMGSIQPLVMLVRDHDSSDLQTFEALLSITNLASFSDNTKQRIVAERGLPIFSYAMFSNNAMIRRAATEAMSNLFPNEKMISYLRGHENLKVWIAFASDFEEHYECARAALGCLAMVSQDLPIANEITKASNAESMMKTVLESGNLDLMHRMLIVVLNLIEHGGKCKDLILSTGTFAFCEAYAQTYQNGGEEHELKLSPSDMKMMKTTVDLAKEIVLAS